MGDGDDVVMGHGVAARAAARPPASSNACTAHCMQCAVLRSPAVRRIGYSTQHGLPLVAEAVQLADALIT